MIPNFKVLKYINISCAHKCENTYVEKKGNLKYRQILITFPTTLENSAEQFSIIAQFYLSTFCALVVVRPIYLLTKIITLSDKYRGALVASHSPIYIERTKHCISNQV